MRYGQRRKGGNNGTHYDCVCGGRIVAINLGEYRMGTIRKIREVCFFAAFGNMHDYAVAVVVIPQR